MCLKSRISKWFSTNVYHVLKLYLKFDEDLTDTEIGRYGFVYRMESDRKYYVIGAAIANDRKLLDFLKHDCDDYVFYGNCIAGALAGGHLELLKEAINDPEVNPFPYDFYAGMGGNMECINYIPYGEYSEEFIEGACEGGHINLVKKNTTDALMYACKGGNMDMVQHLIKLGANNWTAGLYGAYESGNLDIIKLMTDKATDVNWTTAFESACSGMHMELVKYIMKNKEVNLARGLILSVRHGTLYFANKLLDMIEPYLKQSDYNTIMEDLCSLEIFNEEFTKRIIPHIKDLTIRKMNGKMKVFINENYYFNMKISRKGKFITLSYIN